MIKQEKKGIVKNFLKLYETGDIKTFTNILPEILDTTISPWIKDIRSCFEKPRVIITDLIEERDSVVAFWSLNGKNVRSLFDLPPTDKELSFTGTTLFRFKNNMIISTESIFDNLTLLQQIGKIILEIDEEIKMRDYLTFLKDIKGIPDKYKS